MRNNHLVKVFILIFCLISLCGCSSINVEVEFTDDLNYSTEEIDLNFQEYAVKDRENNIYKHLQFRDVYDNKMNFMVLRDYEDDGLSYYRTETIYL